MQPAVAGRTGGGVGAAATTVRGTTLWRQAGVGQHNKRDGVDNPRQLVRAQFILTRKQHVRAVHFTSGGSSVRSGAGKRLTKRTLCGIVLFKLNPFLVMFLRVPSIDSTCFPHM